MKNTEKLPNAIYDKDGLCRPLNLSAAIKDILPYILGLIELNNHPDYYSECADELKDRFEEFKEYIPDSILNDVSSFDIYTWRKEEFY